MCVTRKRRALSIRASVRRKKSGRKRERESARERKIDGLCVLKLFVEFAKYLNL